MLEKSRECGMEFVEFVSMVINDATFLLDESLAALTKINEIEAQMERREVCEDYCDYFNQMKVPILVIDVSTTVPKCKMHSNCNRK